MPLTTRSRIWVVPAAGGFWLWTPTLGIAAQFWMVPMLVSLLPVVSMSMATRSTLPWTGGGGGGGGRAGGRRGRRLGRRHGCGHGATAGAAHDHLAALEGGDGDGVADE